MSGKNRAILLAVATAGLIGAMAPAAYAAGPGGNNNSLLNISGNQIPVQACNDTVPVNGIGGLVPAQGLSGALSILSPGSITSAFQNSSCTAVTNQTNANTTTTNG